MILEVEDFNRFAHMEQIAFCKERIADGLDSKEAWKVSYETFEDLFFLLNAFCEKHGHQLKWYDNEGNEISQSEWCELIGSIKEVKTVGVA